MAVERPPSSIGRAMAGAGGVLFAAGVVTLGGQRWASTGSTGLAILLAMAVLGSGAAATVRCPPPLAVAGVGASGVAAPAVAFFVSAGSGFPSIREVALIAGLLLAALYAVGPWRGHTFHLSILAAAGWLLALSLADLGIGGSAFGGLNDTVGDALSTAGAASMVLGVLYLGLGSWLHDTGLEGMATPFLNVAALALPAGALAVARDLPAGGAGVVGVVVGAAVGLVGARCRRRGTTWLGLAVSVVGVVTVGRAMSDSLGVVAVATALAGAAMVALAPLAAALVGEPDPSRPTTSPGVMGTQPGLDTQPDRVPPAESARATRPGEDQ